MKLTAGRIVTLLAGVGAVVLLIVCIPLMTSTMRAPGANCGTVFASSDSWTYTSSFDPSDNYDGAISSADIEAGASAAVSDFMADLNVGAAVYRYCEGRHSDRRTLLITLGSIAFALGALTVVAVGAMLLRSQPRPARP